MSFLIKGIVAGALVTALGTSAPAQLLRPYPYQVDMPYELVPDFFKPNFPAGLTWGAIGGVYAESPDRIYIYLLNGLLPTVAQFVGADGMPARDNTTQEGLRREYILTVFDGTGNRIEHWKDLDAMHQVGHAGHRIKVNPLDPDKHVWLIDEGEMGQVLKMTRNGKLVMRIGSEKGTGCQGAQDIAFTPNGDFWCVEGPEIPRVIKFSKDGKRLPQEFGKRGSGPGELGFRAHAITIDRRGRIYIGDRGNFRIQVFDQNGQFLESWPDINAFTLSIDKNDRLWTMCGTEKCGASKPPHGMTAFDVNSGKVLFTWGVAGGLPGQLYAASQFDVDREGNLYTIENRGGRAQKWRPKKGANPNHLIAWPLDMRQN